MGFAITLAENGMDKVPRQIVSHAGWQILLVLGHLISGFTFNKVGFIIALLCLEATALILLFWYLPDLKKSEYPIWKSSLLILGVMLATPVSILWFIDGFMYIGYVGITTYHNPTMYLLKPFAILQFIFAYQCYENKIILTRNYIVFSAIVSMLTAYVKPNFAICILPAMGILTVFRLLKKQYININAVLFGIGIPTILVLAWQFLVTYNDNVADGIIFSPLSSMSFRSKYLFLKFILSIPFPLFVLITEFKRATSDIRISLGWVSFIFGILYVYLFSEVGPRSHHGNFWWSGQITLFLLFASSTLFLTSLPKGRNKIILTGMWLLQVLAGILYLIRIMFIENYY